MPHPYLRKSVLVGITATTVEILLAGKRIAAHARSYCVGGYTTQWDHRPQSHQRHLEWSPDRLIRWGAVIGSSTGALVQKILESRPHPEQGYRSCLGLMRLGKQYSPERLEAACSGHCASRRSIRRSRSPSRRHWAA